MRTRLGHQACIAAVAGVVFFANLGGPKLWDDDEPRNATCAREMFERGDPIVPTFNHELRTDKPVLVYWLMMGSYALFGVTEFAARFPSAVLGLCTALATYHLGRLLFRPQVGLWAGLVMATNLMFGVAARAATPDSTLICCTTLALVAYVWSMTGGHEGGFLTGLAVDSLRRFCHRFPEIMESRGRHLCADGTGDACQGTGRRRLAVRWNWAVSAAGLRAIASGAPVPERATLLERFNLPRAVGDRAGLGIYHLGICRRAGDVAESACGDGRGRRPAVVPLCRAQDSRRLAEELSAHPQSRSLYAADGRASRDDLVPLSGGRDLLLSVVAFIASRGRRSLCAACGTAIRVGPRIC